MDQQQSIPQHEAAAPERYLKSSTVSFFLLRGLEYYIIFSICRYGNIVLFLFYERCLPTPIFIYFVIIGQTGYSVHNMLKSYMILTLGIPLSIMLPKARLGLFTIIQPNPPAWSAAGKPSLAR